MGYMVSSFIEAIESSGSSFDPRETFRFVKLIPIILMILMTALWLWYWSLGVGIQKYIPEELKLNTGLFKTLYFIPIIFMVASMVFMSIMIDRMFADTFDFDPESFSYFFWLFMALQFIVMGCMIYLLYFAAKSVKTAQLKKKVKFGEFVGEFFLLWIYPIGVWIIQPEVNKVVDDYTMENFDA